MNADDLQELYKLIRGSRSAMMVLDARTLFLERKLDQAETLLNEARELFAESRFRMLRQDPEKDVKGKGKEAERQAKRLIRKQDKAKEILEKFDEYLGELKKMAKRDEERRRRHAPAEPKAQVSATDAAVEDSPTDHGESSQGVDEHNTQPAHPSLVSEDFAAAFRETAGDDQLAIISQHFGFCEVSGSTDIHPDALYFIRSGDKSFLIRTRKPAIVDDEVPIASVVDKRTIKPFSVAAFLKLGKKRRMVLLTAAEPTN